MSRLLQQLASDHTDCFRTQQRSETKIKCAHLLVDVSNLLHELLAAPSREHFFEWLFQRLDWLLRTHRPTRTLFLALDGAAPLAKLIAQRSKRAKDANAIRKGPVRSFSTIQLTAGTSEMDTVMQELNYYAANRLKPDKAVVHIVSGSDREGRSDAKIFDFLHHHSDEINSSLERAVVVSSHADLVLFALRSPVKRLLVEQLLPDRQVRTIDIDRLRQSIVAPLQIDQGSAPEVRSAVDDFVQLCLLVGTDFTPAVSGVDASQLPALWQVCARLRGGRDIDSTALQPFNGKLVVDVLNDGQVTKPLADQAKTDAERERVRHFARALAWTFDYFGARCTDCSQFLPASAMCISRASLIRGYDQETTLEHASHAPLKPLEYLVAVTPQEASDVLPEPFKQLIQGEDSPLAAWTNEQIAERADEFTKQVQEAVQAVLESANKSLASRNARGHSLMFRWPTDEERQIEAEFTAPQSAYFAPTDTAAPVCLTELRGGPNWQFSVKSNAFVKSREPVMVAQCAAIATQTRKAKQQTPPQPSARSKQPTKQIPARPADQPSKQASSTAAEKERRDVRAVKAKKKRKNKTKNAAPRTLPPIPEVVLPVKRPASETTQQSTKRMHKDHEQ